MKKNTKLIILLFLIGVIQLKGQTPTWYWAKSFGSVNYDNASAICTDKAGNVYITGTFRSSSISIGDYKLYSLGYEDIFIVKLSSNGTVIWAKSGGGQNSDNASSIDVDNNGNVYIVGNYASSKLTFGNLSVNNNGSYDVFVAKFDNNGNIVWLDNAGGNGNEHCTSLKVCQNDNIYVTGYFNSFIAYFGDEYYNNNGGYDYFILRYLPDGSVNHVEVGGGAKNDYINSIDIDNSNNINLAIASDSDSLIFGSNIVKNNGMSDMFIAQYNLNFENKWAISIGGLNNDIISGIKTDNLGNIFIAGSFLSNEIIIGDDTVKKSGSYDVFVAKFRHNGDYCWMRSGVGISSDNANTIDVDNSSNVYIAGHFKSAELSIGNFKISNNGSNDVYIAKFDSIGEIKWINNLGGADDEYCYSINISSIGEVYIAGYFASETIVAGNSVLQNNGYVDLFIAKLGNDLSLTYNITDVLCNYETNGAISIEVTGGDIPYTYKWSTGGTSKSISNLQAGVYTVTVIDNNNFALVENIYVKALSNISITSNINSGCNNMNNASIELNVTGGIPEYLYTWSNGSTSKDLTGLTQNNVYTVTVKDNNNCQKTESYNILLPTELQINLNSISDASCNLATDGKVFLTINGGVKPYIYLWSNGAFTRDLNNIKAGTYIITVKDANNCQISKTYTITEPNPLQMQDSIKHVTCFGYNNGEIKITILSGTGPYHYLWSNGAIMKDIKSLTAGAYTITASDPTGCSMIKAIVTQPKMLNLALTIVDDTNNRCIGSAYTQPSGGTAPYLYKWDDSRQQEVKYIKKLCEGTYIVSVTDANGCTIKDTAIINNIDLIGISEIEKKEYAYIFPNPLQENDNLHIISTKNIDNVKIYDNIGRCIFSK